MTPEILHFSAFTTDPDGGNQAGVVLDARGLPDTAMQRIARELDYSETAFLLPRDDGSFDIRYFSPKAEVSFCGHATIAAAIAYAGRFGPGDQLLHTRSGPVLVEADARGLATLVSVPPRVEPLESGDLGEILGALGWRHEDLDRDLSPALAFAGAWHPVLVVSQRSRLANLDYDFGQLASLMARRNWTTISLLWRESADVLHARNPFPPGGIFEDPATGAAAAAVGAYLAKLAVLPVSRSFTIRQGEDMGRPSLLHVHVPVDPAGGIRVSGAAVELPGRDRPAAAAVRA